MDMIQIRNGSSGILVMSGRNKKAGDLAVLQQCGLRFSATTDLSAERCENVIEKECVENVGRKIKRVFPWVKKMMPMPGICGRELFEDADNSKEWLLAMLL